MMTLDLTKLDDEQMMVESSGLHCFSVVAISQWRQHIVAVVLYVDDDDDASTGPKHRAGAGLALCLGETKGRLAWCEMPFNIGPTWVSPSV